MLQHIDATQIVDGLCQRLQEAEFGDYNTEDELLLDVAEVVAEHVNNEIGEFASVWVEGRDRGKIKAVWAYGTDFWPDITIEARELPWVAIEVKLVKRDDDLANSIGSAIGQALVYSVQYSYVIAFILDRAVSDLRKHWFDSEIESRLWDYHRIRLIIRQ